MISICIPIYNYDVRPLVSDLANQLEDEGVKAELVLIDDSSQKEYKEINGKVCSKHTYIELVKNIGRSKIRNLFLAHANYDAMLFLDCDCKIISKDFIKQYMPYVTDENCRIVCGGRIYGQRPKGRSQFLHWKYGVLKESKRAHERKLTPNQSFMTNNFLVKRAVLEQIKFDERIGQYGHEDTLFGFELNNHSISITHIENPILNGDIESNPVFLDKTDKGLQNLLSILDYVDCNVSFIQEVTALKVLLRVTQSKFKFIIKSAFFVLKNPVRFILSQGIVILPLFDFYKLGYLLKNMPNSLEKKLCKAKMHE
ncbi:glycosyltransferase [Candidatus Peregrinibacteria bacterium]|nr:glycosyltransferase [Candidatus Peregrinibacteria bacterium]